MVSPLRLHQWRSKREADMHALIIEDERMVARVIEDVLRECGFTSFDVAASAHTALIAAAFRRPDIITSDVELKPGCGIATVESISQGAAIPTVFITGHGANVTQRLPNYRVIDKPFTVTTLIAAVASAMLQVPGQRGGKRENSKTRGQPGKPGTP